LAESVNGVWQWVQVVCMVGSLKIAWLGLHFQPCALRYGISLCPNQKFGQKSKAALLALYQAA